MYSYQYEENLFSANDAHQSEGSRKDIDRKQRHRIQHKSIDCYTESQVPDPKSIQDLNPVPLYQSGVEFPYKSKNKVTNRDTLRKEFNNVYKNIKCYICELHVLWHYTFPCIIIKIYYGQHIIVYFLHTCNHSYLKISYMQKIKSYSDQNHAHYDDIDRQSIHILF